MPGRIVNIRFLTAVDENSTRALLTVFENKIREGIRDFVLLISSPGGTVFHGLSVYNYLKGAPVNITTHNYGSIDSIAAVIYCAGGKRYSVPHARFLLHAVSASFVQGCVLEEKQLEERINGLKIDTDNIAGVIAANTGKTEPEIFKAMYERTTLNPEQAQAFGLVHEIKEPLFESGSELISI